MAASLVASTFVFLALFGLRITGNLESLELAAYDWHIRMRPASPPSSHRVVIVTVTEEDIRNVGQWPLSDAILANTLERLAANGARGIGLDIYRDFSVPPGYELLENALLKHEQIIAVMKFPSANSPGVRPPEVLAGSERVGFTDMIVDPGGIVRRGLLFLDDGQNVEYSLPLRVAFLYLQSEGVAVQGDPDNPSHIRIGPTTIRPFEPNDGSYVDADAGGYQFLLDYRDTPDRFPLLTLSDVLVGELDPELIEGKIVLIGVAAESVKDLFYTPYSPALRQKQLMYGVVLQGHMVSQLLRAGLDGHKPVAVISDDQEYLWILIWTLLGGTLGIFVRSAWRFALAAGGGLVMLTLVVHGLFVLGWWIPLVPPALGWVASSALVLAYVSNQEKRERANLMNLFSSYTSPQLAEVIWQQRDQFLSGGRPLPQKLTATAFFTDIADFTTVSEKLDPPTLMDWLSEFMETISPLVSEHGGVILRFIGDSIMAVFGVPIVRTHDLEIRKDAVNAVNCALAIQRRLGDHNKSLKQRGLPLIGMRIGILTGPMVAGSVGSTRHLEYNVHGDTVNTAARLEGYDKEGFAPDYFDSPCRILVGEPTVQLLDNAFQTQLVGEVRLRGKAEMTRIFQIIGQNRSAAEPQPGAEEQTQATGHAATHTRG